MQLKLNITGEFDQTEVNSLDAIDKKLQKNSISYGLKLKKCKQHISGEHCRNFRGLQGFFDIYVLPKISTVFF